MTKETLLLLSISIRLTTHPHTQQASFSTIMNVNGHPPLQKLFICLANRLMKN
jgi:hypothetical protein